MRIRSISLTMLLLASKAILATQYPGCLSLDEAEDACYVCYKRNILKDGKGCGPLNPPEDRCLLNEYHFPTETQTCNICKFEYAQQLTPDAQGDYIPSCVEKTLKKCLIQVNLEEEETCVACDKGQYAVVDRATRRVSCQTISKPVRNCMWGGLAVPERGEARCVRCVQGFALDAMSGKCETPVQVGCWIQVMGFCRACNGFEGYFMDSFGKCFGSGTADGEGCGAVNHQADPAFARIRVLKRIK